MERVPDPDAGGPMRTVQSPQEEVSLLAIVNVILRHRRLLIALPFVFAVFTLAGKLREQRTYTSTTSFLPQSSETRSGGGLANVAAQFGFRMPTAMPSESPAFYADLLRSRAILSQIAESEYTFLRDGELRRGTLVDVYRVDGDTEAMRREKVLRRLSRDIGVTPSRQTDIVQVTVRATQPAVAKQIADRALELVNEFNLEKRQSYARQERAFVDERMQQARQELRLAENALAEFLQRNREFRNSAELSMRHDALQREVGMRQEVFTSLAQNYEQARIEEVRNIPVITILDPPEEPVVGNARGTIAAVLFAAIVGLVVAMMTALVREFFRSTRQRREQEFVEFSRIRGEILSELRRPWKLLRWGGNGGGGSDR